jgi:hypothetical protein
MGAGAGLGVLLHGRRLDLERPREGSGIVRLQPPCERGRTVYFVRAPRRGFSARKRAGGGREERTFSFESCRNANILCAAAGQSRAANRGVTDISPAAPISGRSQRMRL